MYREKDAGWLKHFDFMILDIAAIEFSFAIAYIIRHGTGILHSELPELYTNVALILMLLCVLEVMFNNGYENILNRGHYREFRETFRHTTTITVLLVLYLYLEKYGEEYSRAVYIITWELSIILTYFIREIWKNVLKKSIAKTQQEKASFVIITTSDAAKEIADTMKRDVSIKFKLSGMVITDKGMTGQNISGIPVVAGSEDVYDYLCRNWVDEVFVSLSEDYEKLEEEIINNCIVMGVTVHQKLAKEYSTPGCVQRVEKISDYTVLSSSVNIVTMRQMFMKRLIDIIGGIVGLLITGILFLFLAPIIYIKSPGPIFFKQWRVGRNGKKFQIYKFRSMYMDAEERKAELMAKNKIKDGMMFKIENDPRIIGGEKGKGIGNFIRNTSLDEFPQFYNVLKGDMSLVGTRPPTLDEWEKYKLHHRKRMAIKPGLTGMWQVSGRSDITDFEEVVKLDTEYIMNWNLGKDIKILLKTVKVVLFGKGSY